MPMPCPARSAARSPEPFFPGGTAQARWAGPLGAALGAKLAAPDKMVVSLIGDGGFIYGCPVATLWTASAYHAPFLSVIFNNHGLCGLQGRSCPSSAREGLVEGDMGFEVGIDIKNPPDFAGIARACHAYGQRVEDPSDLKEALRTAVDEVRAGRSAVLDVRILKARVPYAALNISDHFSDRPDYSRLHPFRTRQRPSLICFFRETGADYPLTASTTIWHMNAGGGSSNGRTRAFGARYSGSNPDPPAIAREGRGTFPTNAPSRTCPISPIRFRT